MQKQKISLNTSKILKTGFITLILAVLLLPLYASIFNTAKPIHAHAPSTSAYGMTCVEVNTGRVLYQHNAHGRRAPASTTKIVTAIAVIENTPDLSRVHKIPDSAVGVEGSSIYLARGEQLSVRDLLYGLMLQSGNDCAEALALITSGSKEKFADLMNATARKAGAKNSNFVTPHGLDAAHHYTTAYDLAMISAYALKNPEFAQIVKTQKYTDAPYADRGYNRIITNKNRLLSSFEGCDGVKTGFTKKAGRCYVSSATRGDIQVVCAVLNCGPMFEDCARIMETAFNEFSMQQVLSPREPLGHVNVSNSRTQRIACGVPESIRYPLTKDEAAQLQFKLNLPESLSAPVKIGAEAGSIQVFMQNSLLFETKLYTIESADSLNLWDRLKDIADKWSV
ncbi:MAG: D-alanyl-D-alanine carboxypeptidase [Firmicutes bacterium]|nr:D-alanyl-D-alanine carboxypeptidase [Bacillota bacterium]